MKLSIRRLLPTLPAMLVTFGVLALLTVGSGCATTSEPLMRIVVKAPSENQFLVDDQSVDLDQLPRALKRAGAGYETEIVIEMPAGATPGSMKLVYPTLQSAGFQKVFLSRPREATATVKPLTPVKPSPAKTAPPKQTLSPAGPQRRK
jgi:biopolymer transport protein ExbD